MNILDTVDLMHRYSKCPYCGCEPVGDGTGVMVIDTKPGYFYRACRCGWSITIRPESFDMIFPNPDREVPTDAEA